MRLPMLLEYTGKLAVVTARAIKHRGQHIPGCTPKASPRHAGVYTPATGLISMYVAHVLHLRLGGALSWRIGDLKDKQLSP